MPPSLSPNYTAVQFQYLYCRTEKPSIFSVSDTKLLLKDARLWPGSTAKSLCGFKGSIARLARPVLTKLLCTKAHRKRPYLEHRWDDLLPLLCSYLDTRKMCALIGILLRISASCLPFCLNETAPVVCYEKKKANNPSLNNRAELKKKNLAPGCPSASGPGIRLQLAQLHSLTQAIFSRKKTWYPLFPKLWLHRYNNLSYFFRQKSSCDFEGVGNLTGNCLSLNRFRAAKSRF